MVSAEDAGRTDSLHHKGGGRVPFPPATSRPGPSRLLVIRPASPRPRAACLPPERLSIMAVWGYSSIGRALRSHRRGRGFESPYLHQNPISRGRPFPGRTGFAVSAVAQTE